MGEVQCCRGAWLLHPAKRSLALYRGSETQLISSLAVEMAVVHNFVWHQFLTWKDRSSEKRYDWLKRLFAFNLTNGAVSLAGNLFFVWLIIGRQRIWLLAANLFAIAVCSVINFVLSDKLIFRIAANEP